jgi:two-component system, OmpR family, sensor histidine kinase ChvG
VSRRGARPTGRIAVRIFAFNALLAFLPVAAFSLLDTYEKGLVAALEHALAQQARVTAAWLGQTAVAAPAVSVASARAASAVPAVPAPGDTRNSPNATQTAPAPRLDAAAARRVLAAIGDKRTARFRIVDTGGRLLADSSDREASQESSAAAAGRSSGSSAAAEGGEPFIYRVFSMPSRAWRRFFAPPAPPIASADYYASAGPVLLGIEVREALEGRYGAATRVSSGGQVSVTLYSAVPVTGADGAVAGAVLVSQSTYRILRDLYAIRLDIAWIFLGSLVAAAALSFLLAFTIVSPLRRLGAAAAAALSPAGARPEAAAAFPETRRADEIGDLQRALRALALRLDERMRQLERFAADAAHEFRNPLAAIRSAAELALSAPDPADRARFLGAIVDDAERLRATVDGLRRLSLAEAGAGSGAAAPVDAAEAARAACEGVKLRAALGAGPGGGGRPVGFAARGGSAAALVDPAALDVMLANLLDNAAAFAKSAVEVEVSAEDGFVVVAVEDDGPGFPPEHLGRVFDRFFTWRPGERKGAHTGLGLSLVKALAAAGGGSVEAANRPGGGARLVLRLPAAPTAK